MRKLFKGLLWVVGVVAVAALVLRALVVTVWVVPDDPVLGASLAPTLAAGDTVLVLTRGTATFGELVRCPDPDQGKGYIVGRIAGLPGDVVETDGSTLTVNGTRYGAESGCPEPKVFVKHPSTGVDVEMTCDVVAMGGGRHLRAIGPRAPLERPMRTEVRPDTVFLISDDRSFHDDSRDFGLQPRSACKQRILFRLWSKEGWGDEESRFTYVR